MFIYDSLISTAVIRQVITETIIPETINQGSISIVSYPFVVEQDEWLLNRFYIVLAMG